MAEVDVKKFAERVERLCDFLLDRLSEDEGRTGSDDQKILEDLKDDAANLQMFGSRMSAKTLSGLHDYMHAVPKVTEEEQ